MRPTTKLLAVAAIAGVFLNLPSLEAASDKPNIVLIMADDLGYECIGANGGESYKTPQLDRLAAEGVRFTHCYAQPLCTPSRVKIMTGRVNPKNYTRFGVLDRNATTFAHLLKDQGYKTAIAGKWQLGRELDAPQHFGFERSLLWQQARGRTREGGFDTRFSNPRLMKNGVETDFDNGEFGPELATEFLCDFIDNNKDTPFLVYYPMILTHCPFIPTPDSPDYDPESPGSPTYKGDPKYFGGMVEYMDKLVGRIVAQLESSGVRDNTLILFTGDNGTDEPIVSRLNGRDVAGAKGEMIDAGTRVPLIANWPARSAKGTVCDDLVDFSDFLPTMVQSAGFTPPDSLDLDGRSFLPQLLGQQGDPREWIYIWYSRNGDDQKAQVFARNQRYKLYRSGAFYDISHDVREKSDLSDRISALGLESKRAMLRAAIDQYQPAVLARSGKEN